MRYFALLLRFKMLFYNSRVFESWLIPSSFILHCKIFAVKGSFIFALLFSLNFLIFDKLQQIFSTNSPLVASAKSRNARGASHASQPSHLTSQLSCVTWLLVKRVCAVYLVYEFVLVFLMLLKEVRTLV